MKPFNLNEALAGHPVVTRDGRKVTQLHLFDVTSPYCLCGVIDRELRSFTKEGYHSILKTKDTSDYDLFMESTKTKKWINIYKSQFSDEVIAGQQTYDSEQVAKNNVWNTMEYFNTIEIEV